MIDCSPLNRFVAALIVLSCCGLLAPNLTLLAEDTPVSGEETQRRVAWTSSRIKGTPEPPLPYTTERVFPSLQFNQCLELSALPGSNRLFIVEQSGKVFSFPNHLDASAAELVVDFAKAIPGVEQVYSLVFHPDFARNRYCYVCYIKAAGVADGTQVARFRVEDADPPTIDVNSEVTLITWLSGGHNGCCLKFGPDGYLYISTGDAGPASPPDPLRTGQDVRDLLSSILRIDVDHAEEGRSYRIPADNPFVAVPEARGEVWAYGLRNPWRMSFDAKTGDLWVGDVGWELWEMLYRVERGGNYGWSVTEGLQSTHPEWDRGPTPILPPTIDHSHTESSSITEGMTYYGSRLPELQSFHLYGDYDTGKFWGFRFENGKVVDHRELADTAHRVVSFGDDGTGEILVLDHGDGTIHRLISNPDSERKSTFPRSLSESGLFSSLLDLIPAPGVLPYVINAEPWADYATAERHVAVPQQLSIHAAGSPWSFPDDSVLVKTLSLEMREGDATSRRRVETQILHFDGREWMPYTYRWDDAQNDASLVGAAGEERVFDVEDPSAPGGRRTQTWRYAGRAECQRCHNRWSGPPLGFNALQLDRDSHRVDLVGDSVVSQLEAFAKVQLIEPAVPTQERPPLVDLRYGSADLERQARSYLHVNCAHCHRANAGGAVLSQMQYDLPLDEAKLIGTRPTQGTFGIHGAQVIAAGDPFRSVLLYRMSKLGSGRMPHLGSEEVDRRGIALLHDWISQMPEVFEPEKADGTPASDRSEKSDAALSQLISTKVEPSQIEAIDLLLSSTSGAMALLRALDVDQLPASAASIVVQRGAHHADASIRDLFERFLPPQQRIQRLGSVVQADQILSLVGDPVRGRHVFFDGTGVSCKNCHRVEPMGATVGPELTTIGQRLSRAEILESILEPSKRIDPKYVTYLVETTDGRIASGLLVQNANDEVVLQDSQARLIRFRTQQVEQLVPQRQSLMPDLLLRDMTAQQVADLLAYLSSLK